MKTLQKTKVVFLAALLFLGIWNENVLTGWAAGAKEQVLMQLETEAAVYEEATEDSIVVATLPKGDGGHLHGDGITGVVSGDLSGNRRIRKGGVCWYVWRCGRTVRGIRGSA